MEGQLNSIISVEGDVISKGNGATALRSVDINIGGNIVSENGFGAYSDEFSSIVIKGDVSATSFGVHAVYDAATVQVDGTISAPTPILVGHTAKTLDDYDDVGTGDLSDYLIYSLGSLHIYVRNHPELEPVAASFDKNGGTDIVIVTKPYSASLLNIYNGEDMLAAGTDYTVLDNMITISNVYLNQIPLGNYDLNLDFSNGVDPVFGLSVVDSTPVTDPSTAETTTITTVSTTNEAPVYSTTSEITVADSAETNLPVVDVEQSEVPKTGEKQDKITIGIIIILLLTAASARVCACQYSRK